MTRDDLIGLMCADAEQALEKGNKAEAALTRYWLKRVEQIDNAPPVNVEEPDLIGATAAAQLLGRSRRWVYKYQSKLPFVIRFDDDRLKFSRRGIAEYLSVRRTA